MLGAARASEYAGWWLSSPKAFFTASSTLAPTRTASPNYSWLQDPDLGFGTSAAVAFRNSSNVAEGYFDITGLTGFTGYNQVKAAHVYSFYLPSSSWTAGLSDQICGAFNAILYNSGTTSFYNTNFNTVTVSGVTRLKLTYQPGAGSSYDCYLPGAYTAWTDRWLTFVACQSNTSTSFTGWTASTSGNVFTRMRIYDSETDVVVGSASNGAGTTTSDFGNNTTTWTPGLATLPTTLYSAETSGQGFEVNSYGQNSVAIVMTNYWNSLGQTFDPLSVTNRTWLTATPSSTIDTCKAWNNAQLIDYVQDPAGYASGYYAVSSGQDLYTNPSDLQVYFQNSAVGTNWVDAYSPTNIIRNT
jgi:hypothetical protein